MTTVEQLASSQEVSVEIGGMPIVLRTPDPGFLAMVEQRYHGYLGRPGASAFSFDVEVRPDYLFPPDDGENELRVWKELGRWRLERGDFLAEMDPATRTGRILQAASAIRGGRAFLFSGISGAGKTTISRLAPPDVMLLTDEISYVRRDGEGYRACGTPFAGELAQPGENASAPVERLFFLAKGPENRIDRVDPAGALRMLLRNILFFADDADLVKMVFRSAAEFLERIPASQLTFFPDARVWQLIE